MAVTKRINTARGHYYKLDGEKADGVTGIIGDGVPKPALVGWAAREVATFAANNLDTLAALDVEERIDLLKGAHWRDRDKAARRGTEVHRLAETLVHGDEVEVPDELAGHVDSYIAFLEQWRPAPIIVEGVCGHRTHRWMGTFDLVADMAGERWLLDLKTTRSGIYGETALQLAAYRNAEFVLVDGKEQPMPQVTQVGAIWCRADGYDLVPVEAGPEVYRMFRYAQQTAAFVKRYSKEWVGDVLSPPGKDAA